MNNSLPESELILNADGSIYHLKLKPGDIADKVITVGDPDRVDQIESYFDKVHLKRQCREFKTITGTLGNTRLSVISTGIGTDNVDIVMNELDLLVNVDFKTRQIRDTFRQLSFFRLGTSGAIHNEIETDSVLVSEYAIGYDALGQYYHGKQDVNLEELHHSLNSPLHYMTKADEGLLNLFKKEFRTGITLTMPGFYHPQGRKGRVGHELVGDIRSLFGHNTHLGPLTNIEMETSGIYLLSKHFGHRAISVNAILANRCTAKFSKNPEKTVSTMIEKSLELICSAEC